VAERQSVFADVEASGGFFLGERAEIGDGQENGAILLGNLAKIVGRFSAGKTRKETALPALRGERDPLSVHLAGKGHVHDS